MQQDRARTISSLNQEFKKNINAIFDSYHNEIQNRDEHSIVIKQRNLLAHLKSGRGLKNQ